MAGYFMTGGVKGLDFRFAGVDSKMAVAAGKAGGDEKGTARAVFFEQGRAGIGGGSRGVIEAEGQQGAGQTCIMALEAGGTCIDQARQPAAQFAVKRAVSGIYLSHQTTCA